jgi:putative ABC transport system permease protein
VLGLVFAVAGLAGIRSLYSGGAYEDSLDVYDRLTKIDFTVVAVTLTLALLAGLLAGLYPAWRIGRTAPAVYLKSQ